MWLQALPPAAALSVQVECTYTSGRPWQRRREPSGLLRGLRSGINLTQEHTPSSSRRPLWREASVPQQLVVSVCRHLPGSDSCSASLCPPCLSVHQFNLNYILNPQTTQQDYTPPRPQPAPPAPGPADSAWPLLQLLPLALLQHRFVIIECVLVLLVFNANQWCPETFTCISVTDRSRGAKLLACCCSSCPSSGVHTVRVCVWALERHPNLPAE